MKNFNAQFRISRFSSSTGPEGISISINDQDSRIVICEFDLTLEQFGQVVTGLLVEDIEAKSFVADGRLGTKQEINTREVFCPIQSWDRKIYEEWLKENVELGNGEISSFYLGSNDSILRKEDGVLLRYTVKSWPDSSED